ncbi:hypothetical protein KAS08_01835 [Candidatus Pacearchaeota archaeon]|nr:hypothetical protein [Candidatus Pacearchaeota archaeon]
MRKIVKKGQFNFAWLFAILAGAAILFLAIFGAMKTGDTARFQTDTQVAKQISILTDPLQAGFSEGSFGSISFKKETRVNNICFSDEFGKNDISVSTKSEVGEEWNLPGATISIHNKYIFSKERSSGLDYYVLSKPFNLPYKVADLIFMISENYCFTGAPEEIETEILGLGIPNIEINNCTVSDSIKVCFSSTSNCDIVVSGSCYTNCDSLYDKGTVIKKDSNEDVNFVGNLMYAAIFSDKRNYDCNVKRLLYRTKKIARELSEKTAIMSTRGCTSSLNSDLVIWESMLNSTTPDTIDNLLGDLEELENKNYREQCNLW